MAYISGMWRMEVGSGSSVVKFGCGVTKCDVAYKVGCGIGYWDEA